MMPNCSDEYGILILEKISVAKFPGEVVSQ